MDLYSNSLEILILEIKKKMQAELQGAVRDEKISVSFNWHLSIKFLIEILAINKGNL